MARKATDALYDARRASNEILNRLCGQEQPDLGLVLGTGWNNVIDEFNPLISLPFSEIYGLKGNLGTLNGHAREFVFGNFAGKKVIALNGRIHLNEAPASKEVPLMVRLQIQVLLELGI